jgi:hypothetical protein
MTEQAVNPCKCGIGEGNPYHRDWCPCYVNEEREPVPRPDNNPLINYDKLTATELSTMAAAVKECT